MGIASGSSVVETNTSVTVERLCRSKFEVGNWNFRNDRCKENERNATNLKTRMSLGIDC